MEPTRQWRVSFYNHFGTRSWRRGLWWLSIWWYWQVASWESSKWRRNNIALETVASTESSDCDEPVKLTTKVFNFCSKLENHFVTNDYIGERTAQFKRELKSWMACYHELYKALPKTGPQRLITEFVVKCSAIQSERENYNLVEDNTERTSTERINIIKNF